MYHTMPVSRRVSLIVSLIVMHKRLTISNRTHILYDLLYYQIAKHYVNVFWMTINNPILYYLWGTSILILINFREKFGLLTGYISGYYCLDGKWNISTAVQCQGKWSTRNNKRSRNNKLILLITNWFY